MSKLAARILIQVFHTNSTDLTTWSAIYCLVCISWMLDLGTGLRFQLRHCNMECRHCKWQLNCQGRHLPPSMSWFWETGIKIYMSWDGQPLTHLIWSLSWNGIEVWCQELWRWLSTVGFPDSTVALEYMESNSLCQQASEAPEHDSCCTPLVMPRSAPKQGRENTVKWEE